MRPYPVIFAALLLAACETPPSVRQVQAVKTQNIVTQKHITQARQHIDRARKAEQEQSDHLQAALSDLDELLQASPTPSPRKKRK